ncbi:hypothetical protein JXQ70_07520 [bacterium]|nr:hypothetical protein [bacterium]
MDFVFFSDAPLARLTRWVRILGYACFHCPELSIRHLVMPGGFDERSVILTRQIDLYRHVSQIDWPGQVIFIKDNDWRKQVRQIIHDLHLPRPSPEFKQCLLCGAELEPISRNAVSDRVPVFVYDTVDQFRMCPECKRIYWSGTHSRRLVRHLDELFGPDETLDS